MWPSLAPSSISLEGGPFWALLWDLTTGLSSTQPLSCPLSAFVVQLLTLVGTVGQHFYPASYFSYVFQLNLDRPI